VVVITYRGKTKENFKNFHSNEPFDNFTINYKKLTNEIDLDPLRMSLIQEIEIVK